MKIDFDQRFKERIENIETGNGFSENSEYPCVMHPGSRLEMFGALCRMKEKWGMYIFSFDDVEKKDVEKHLPFHEDLTENALLHALKMDGEAYVFFDSQEKMNDAYRQVTDQGINGNSFYVATVHKKGPVLNENT